MTYTMISPIVFSLFACVCNLNSISGMSVSASNGYAPASPRNAITIEATYVKENNMLHQPLIQKYTVKSLGWYAYGGHLRYSDNLSGLYDIQGKRTVAFGRSYNVITIENGHFVSKTFDVYESGVKSLTEYLQLIPLGKTVIIASQDEPETKRLDEPLPELIYQFGGSKKVFGESIRHQSAYVLFGARGIGEGKGKEYFSGSVPGSMNSWIMTNFFVTGDTIIPESEVGHSLIDTLGVIGAKTSILPSSMWSSGASKTKPMEVTEMDNKITNGISKMRMSISF